MKHGAEHAHAPRPRWLRDLVAHEAARDWLGSVVAITVLLTVPMVLFPHWTTMGLLAIPLCLGSLVLGPRFLPWLVLLVLIDALVMLGLRWQPTHTDVVSVVMVVVLAVIILAASMRRSTLGVSGVAGESMLVDLRDRILAQGAIPKLPRGWQVESVLRSAGGTPFAGDFVVAARVKGATRFDVVLVDVSGKGEQAGTRALLLSGALGGLMTATSPQEFLPAANNFLLRQLWDEGFATAIHLTLDLGTGYYEVRSAGHPPAVVFDRTRQVWQELEAEGPALGWWPAVDFEARTGVLAPGDAILLYTDGMVETREASIDAGIRRLEMGAEKMLQHRMTAEGVAQLVQDLGSTADDRALVAVRRIGFDLENTSFAF